jgi:hypothetical protein
MIPNQPIFLPPRLVHGTTNNNVLQSTLQETEKIGYAEAGDVRNIFIIFQIAIDLHRMIPMSGSALSALFRDTIAKRVGRSDDL